MAGLFSPATLEQIRAASDIVEVIGAYLPLKRAGANFVALCPFHKEKTPSFNVNPHRQIFHCFGCHKGGDVFRFVQEYENLTFPEAVRRLAERARIPLAVEPAGAEAHARQLKDKLLHLHEQITQRWQNVLAREPTGQAARDYLAGRGVSAEAAQLFRLGAAPDAWDDTVNWARSKGYDPALVEQAGLIVRKEGAEHYYDRFRGRLIFPICDEQGRVIAFSGRVLTGQDQTAKYINSPETPIFTKGKVFYGLDKSRRALLDAGFAVVCEGQLDLIACFMAGVRNVVAPQGTAFTAEQARILRRYVDEVVLCFDSDEAGQNAAARSLDALLAAGLAVRVALVPAPHDPDSYIRAFGAEAFQQLIARAEGFFDYYLQRLCRLHDVATDRGRLAVLRLMAEAVHKTGNAVLVDNYARKTALWLAVSPDAVRAEFNKLAQPTRGLPESPGSPPAAAGGANPPSAPEAMLLKLLLRLEDVAGWVAEHLQLDWLQHPVVREVVSARLAAHREGRWHGVAALLDDCPTAAAQALITEAAAEERAIPHPAQQLQDVLIRLRNQYCDREVAACTRRLGQPETPEAEHETLLRRQAQLRQLKKLPLPPPPGLVAADAPGGVAPSPPSR